VTEIETGRRQHPLRTYLALDSDEGPLNGHYSLKPDDESLFDYEIEARAIVGAEGPLRAPPVLAHGPGWMLARTVVPEPVDAEESVRRAVAGAARIAELDLPAAPWPKHPGGLRALARRRAGLVRAPIALRDVTAARRIVSSCPIPPVTSHGSYQFRHIFPADGAVYVIDWELAAKRPAGYDLLTYEAVLDPDDPRREAVWRATLELVGRGWERELARLRYALLVRIVAGKFVDDGEPERAMVLLPLVAERRAAAGL
jgi:hypothetical protein